MLPGSILHRLVYSRVLPNATFWNGFLIITRERQIVLTYFLCFMMRLLMLYNISENQGRHSWGALKVSDTSSKKLFRAFFFLPSFFETAQQRLNARTWCYIRSKGLLMAIYASYISNATKNWFAGNSPKTGHFFAKSFTTFHCYVCETCRKSKKCSELQNLQLLFCDQTIFWDLKIFKFDSWPILSA